MKKLGNKHQVWLEKRKTYLGGTDLGSILGVNSYRSALDVYLDKTSPEVEEEVDNEAMYWGRNLEDVVLKEYAKRTGSNVIPSMSTIHHDKYPFLACNIDGWVSNGFILECKTAGFRSAHLWGEEGTDDIQESYLCQVAFYCAITKAKRADIAVLIGGQDFRIYTYEANEDFQDKLIQAGVNFWQDNVLKKVPPPAMNTTQLAKLYNKSNEKPIDAETDTKEKVLKLKEMKLMKRDLELDIEEAQFEIQDFMREYDVLKDDKGDIIATWKNRAPRRIIDSKKLQKDLPHIYSDYLKAQKPSRAFLIK